MGTAPFEPTAKLINASAMKQSLDATGKVALQVNFATDSTVIEASSKPQVDQVVQLLQDDPSLRLSIDGHTDNTGDGQHNQVLSEGRAESVRSEEHTSELQSLMRISYAVFCLKKKKILKEAGIDMISVAHHSSNTDQYHLNRNRHNTMYC